MYEPRDYRILHSEEDLYRFRVVNEETDLDIGIKKEQYTPDLQEKVELFIEKQRQILKGYIKQHPAFLMTLKPWNSIGEKVPFPILAMCESTRLAGVGPMAAVAGFIAEQAGLFLAHFAEDVIVENGGDIWLKSTRKRNVSIYAGTSPFSQQIGIEVNAQETPLGVCTSSGTVGYSLSFGRADAVVVVAPSAILADAVTTAACNVVQESADLVKAVDWAVSVPGVQGAIAILGDEIAIQGDIRMISYA